MAAENAPAQNNRAAVGDESAICEGFSKAPEIAKLTKKARMINDYLETFDITISS